MIDLPEHLQPHFEPGMYDGVPNEVYHQCPAVSKSGGTKLLQSTNHYLHYKAEGNDQTAAMLTGDAFHAAVLEPERYEREYLATLLPERPAEGKGWRSKHRVTAYTLAHGGEIEAAAEVIGYKPGTVEKYTKVDGFDALLAHYQNHPGLTPEDTELSADDLATVEAMRDAILEHPAGRWLFEGGHMHQAVERSFWWVDPATGVPCRCRPDFMCWTNEYGWVVADPKSTRDASFYGFRREVAKWSYHMQDAFYRDGISQVLGQPVGKFVFLAADKSAPHNAACYELEPEGVEQGRAAYRYALEQYADWLTNDNHWPGYGDGATFVQTMNVPGWAD